MLSVFSDSEGFSCFKSFAYQITHFLRMESFVFLNERVQVNILLKSIPLER